ncbi:hypothetical protein GJAV_G00266720 [Gymnothorax javanicus]|nr:hypothetical protein GJAV_G00266720 [Gymnothorax javanicus]
MVGWRSCSPTPAPVSRGADGKFIIWSLLQVSWEPGVMYTCRVDHVAKTLRLSKSQPGTTVTVLSGESKYPSVFPLVSCGAGSGGYVILGCIAKDFTPDDITFKWTHEGMTLTTEFLQYPSIQTNGNFMAISHAKVKASDWAKGDTYKCWVESQGTQGTPKAAHLIHTSKQKPTTEQTSIPTTPGKTTIPRRHDQSASLIVMVPSQEELKQNKKATFACLASEFTPKSYSFTWRRNGEILSRGITTHTAERTEGEPHVHSTTSLLRIAADLWATGTNISCEFKHSAGDKTMSVINSLPECSTDLVTVSITPPSNEKLFLERKVEVKCVVTGDVENILSVTWQTGDRTTLVSTEDTVGQSKIYTVSVNYDDWVSGTLYKCIVKHSDSAEPIEKPYKRENGNNQRRPSVFLMTPDKANAEKVTLICAAKGFYPKEVLFSWNAEDDNVDRSKFYTSQVLKTDQGYSAFSQLTVSAADWEKGTIYSCVVHHEAAPNAAKMFYWSYCHQVVQCRETGKLGRRTGEDMQQMTPAGIEPRSLREGHSLYGEMRMQSEGRTVVCFYVC